MLVSKIRLLFIVGVCFQLNYCSFPFRRPTCDLCLCDIIWVFVCEATLQLIRRLKMNPQSPGCQLSHAVPLPVHEEAHAAGPHHEAEVSHEVEDRLLHVQVVLNVPHQVEEDLTLLHQRQVMELADVHCCLAVVVQQVWDDLRPEVDVVVLLGKLRVGIQELFCCCCVNHGCCWQGTVPNTRQLLGLDDWMNNSPAFSFEPLHVPLSGSELLPLSCPVAAGNSECWDSYSSWNMLQSSAELLISSC